MGKIIAYLQQPESLHALTGLLLNTNFGALTVADMIEWFDGRNITVNVLELKERWRDLALLGFAKQLPGGFKTYYAMRIRRKIGYVLTENGEKMAQSLMDCICYISKLQGGEKDKKNASKPNSVGNASKRC